VTGAVNLNSKGISLVPALTLGRPAAIFDLAVRKGDASFEPQLRFALDRTPWSFLVRRYLAVETSPTWMLSRGASAGGYVLYSHGVEPGAPPHTTLVAARASLARRDVLHRLVVQVAPQFYYLRTNGQAGTYVSASASIGATGSPWSLTTIVNQPIRSEVVGGRQFLWNAGVNYSFAIR
jgi:hypothetical protein